MRAVRKEKTFLSNESAVSGEEFAQEIAISDGLKIQKRQGHPKFQPRRSAFDKTSSPTNQKFSERLVHLIKRISTKELGLVMRRIVNVIDGDVDIQRSQLSLVHLCQFAG